VGAAAGGNLFSRNSARAVSSLRKSRRSVPTLTWSESRLSGPSASACRVDLRDDSTAFPP
jgi:hypothetical protein